MNGLGDSTKTKRLVMSRALPKHNGLNTEVRWQPDVKKDQIDEKLSDPISEKTCAVSDDTVSVRSMSVKSCKSISVKSCKSMSVKAVSAKSMSSKSIAEKATAGKQFADKQVEDKSVEEVPLIEKSEPETKTAAHELAAISSTPTIEPVAQNCFKEASRQQPKDAVYTLPSLERMTSFQKPNAMRRLTDFDLMSQW